MSSQDDDDIEREAIQSEDDEDFADFDFDDYDDVNELIEEVDIDVDYSESFWEDLAERIDDAWDELEHYPIEKDTP